MLILPYLDIRLDYYDLGISTATRGGAAQRITIKETRCGRKECDDHPDRPVSRNST